MNGVEMRRGIAEDFRSARDAAHIYNSAVAAWAICAAWEVGALDELNENRKLDSAEFAEAHGLDPLSTLSMFRALASVEIVRRIETVVIATEKFDEIYRTKSFFHWLNRGSAALFRQMPTALVEKNRVGDYYERDAAAIAYACRDISAITYDQTFYAALSRIDFPFTVVADLGCGSGGRLMDMLRRHPGTTGFGIDIAEPSLQVARAEATEEGFGDRARFFQDDVLNLQERPEFREVEVLTCFMMAHDFWPREQCVATLRRLRELFPNVKRFLFGDATRSVDVQDTDLGVFTLGFELGHDLMGTFLPTLRDWCSVFAESGWDLLRVNRIEVAAGEVIAELA
ncbi:MULTISPECIES: class I SAM-dependent methyltransferase [unclassified Amycolatopsis]|uniref:class I SAM-dependent methyltransferase n=1 Tax=unclassified Amycolatopsis TaxID=2618356 RepID=UPI002E10251D|nr:MULTISPECIES: class I SAM-dependent methyltransferase [unclassified Amycolatopsis]WSJ72997.1 methyltransferase domain-containing protein [Amycolatopsis sp. NBC_01307]WSK83276.1 methyltransferase domain-containing protein [Amycolatopsis sp. NBC_01286]